MFVHLTMTFAIEGLHYLPCTLELVLYFGFGFITVTIVTLLKLN